MIRRLAELPRRQRAAVVLRYYLGLPDAAIAAELGCRETTVRSQISRALATLRIDLTPAYQETR
jgi:RNA polymerase sigma factor (sigma-70 family)